jgi:hypothetical protein
MSRNFPSSRTPKSVCQQVTVVRFVEAEACAYLPTQMTSGLELVARVVPFLHLVLLLSEPAKSALAAKNATVMVAARRGPAVVTVGVVADLALQVGPQIRKSLEWKSA